MIGFGNLVKTNASDIQVFKKSVASCRAGENVGILARGVRADVVERGMLLSKPNTLTQTDYVEAQIYVLTKAEGGRSKPLMHNYTQIMFSATWNLAASIRLEDDSPMVMPGDTTKVKILLRKAMVLREGQKFTIRENELTTISGIVTQVLPMSGVEISGFNVLPQKPMKIETNQTAVLAKRKKKKQ